MDFRLLMKQEREAMMRESLLSVKVDPFNSGSRKSSGSDSSSTNQAAKSSLSYSKTKEEEVLSASADELASLSVPVRLQMSQSLDHYTLSCPVRSVFYVPDAISREEGCRLLSMVNKSTGGMNAAPVSVPETLSLWRTLAASSGKWTQLKARKLQQWGRMIRGPEDISSDNLAAQRALAASNGSELPPWLASVAAELVRAGVFPPEEAPNHVLVNDYLPNGGILHHTDGPFYLPNVAILSLGGPMLITFRRRPVHTDIPSPVADAMEETGGAAKPLHNNDDDEEYSVLLRSHSLLVFREDLYTSYLHGIHDGQFFDNIDGPASSSSSSSYGAPVHTIGKGEDRGGGEGGDGAQPGQERGQSSGQDRPRCICLNKSAAGVGSGDRVERHARTSFTFRRTAH